MNNFSRSKISIFAIAVSFSLMVFLLTYILWVLFDRSDYTGAFAITMYTFIFMSSTALIVLSIILHIESEANENEIGIKYTIWALVLSFVFIGQFMFVHIYKRSGIRSKVEKEALIIYWASKVNEILDNEKIENLSEEEKEEIETMIKLKDKKVLKEYEANYYISSILLNGNIFKEREVDKEELSIIASNVI